MTFLFDKWDVAGVGGGGALVKGEEKYTESFGWKRWRLESVLQEYKRK
jgi:hypothetical protein